MAKTTAVSDKAWSWLSPTNRKMHRDKAKVNMATTTSWFLRAILMMEGDKTMWLRLERIDRDIRSIRASLAPSAFVGCVHPCKTCGFLYTHLGHCDHDGEAGVCGSCKRFA